MPRRFAAHDLIGVYATELSRDLDSDVDREAALDRLPRQSGGSAASLRHIRANV